MSKYHRNKSQQLTIRLSDSQKNVREPNYYLLPRNEVGHHHHEEARRGEKEKKRQDELTSKARGQLKLLNNFLTLGDYGILFKGELANAVLVK